MDISGFDGYYIKHIQVSDVYDGHSGCMVELSVENDKVGDFLSQKAVGSTIDASVEGDIVFSGTIRSIKCIRTYLQTNIRVEAVSFTDVMDSEIHNRVFQNPNKTFGQINDFFKTNNIGITCIEESIASQKIEDILVQHNETDFAFLKRLYRQSGQSLFLSNNKRNSCTIEIGEKKKDGIASIESEDIIRFEQTISADNERVKLLTQKLFAVGSELEVFGKKYIVCSRTIESRFENTEIEYQLSKCIDYGIDGMKDHPVSLGLAKVTDNSSEDHLGRIQVEFLSYENVMADEKIWIDYLSPLTEKSGGIVTIPDEGEIVEVFMRESKCIAIGCIRQNELDEKVQDIAKRSMLVRGCLFTVDEKNVEVNVEQNTVSLSDEMMTLSNENFEVIVKDDQCKIGFKDSRIVFEKDSIQLVAGSKTEMKSDEFVIEGSNSVKVKTRSFDVG